MTESRFACLCMNAVTDVRVDDLQAPTDLGNGYRLDPTDPTSNLDSWKDYVGQHEIESIRDCVAWIWVHGPSGVNLQQRLGYFETALLLTRAPLVHGAWVLEGHDSDGGRRVSSFGPRPQSFIKEAPYPLTTETLRQAASTAEHLTRTFELKSLSGRLERGFVSLVLGMRIQYIEESILFLMRALEGVVRADNSKQFVERTSRLLASVRAGLLNELYRVRNKFTHVEPFEVAFPGLEPPAALVRARQLQAFLYHFATMSYRQVLAAPELAVALTDETAGVNWGAVTTGEEEPPFVVSVPDDLWDFEHNEVHYLVDPVALAARAT